LRPLNFLGEEIRGVRLKTKQTYSAEFKEQALAKVLNRESRTVGSVADELNVNALTLKNWMRGAAAPARSDEGAPGPSSHAESLFDGWQGKLAEQRFYRTAAAQREVRRNICEGL
jgi:transposase-like protein